MGLAPVESDGGDGLAWIGDDVAFDVLGVEARLDESGVPGTDVDSRAGCHTAPRRKRCRGWSDRPGNSSRRSRGSASSRRSRCRRQSRVAAGPPQLAVVLQAAVNAVGLALVHADGVELARWAGSSDAPRCAAVIGDSSGRRRCRGPGGSGSAGRSTGRGSRRACPWRGCRCGMFCRRRWRRAERCPAPRRACRRSGSTRIWP